MIVQLLDSLHNCAISVNVDEYMINISERLIVERRRLSLTQDEFATAGGISKRAYCNYEAGSRTCDAEFLAGIAKIGVDVQFILTGVYSANRSAVTAASKADTAEDAEAVSLSERAAVLLSNYEQCTTPMKDAIDRTVRALANRNKTEMALGVMQIGESLFRGK